jgi:hypothetical protein
MAKLKQRIDNQSSLFDLIIEHNQEKTKTEPKIGTLNVELQLREIVDKCIGKCPLSRDIIAAKMAELSGRPVTRFMLDSWTSSAKHGHRFPAELLPCFCIVVGDYEPISFLARKSGVFTLPDRDVLMSELARKYETREECNREIRKIKLYLQDMD